MTRSAKEAAKTFTRGEDAEPSSRSHLDQAGTQGQSGAVEAGADGPTDISAGGWKDVLKRTWTEAGEDNVELISAGVAFYVFLAIVPLLAAIVLTYGIIADPTDVAQHMQQLAGMMPEDAAGIIGDQLTSMVETAGTTAGFALLVAIGVAIYGVMRGAGAIVTALNIVFDVEESRSFLRRTAVTLAIALGAVMMFVLASLAISAVGFIEALLPGLGGATHVLIQIGFALLAALGVSLVVAVVYRYAPNHPKPKWRWITAGSAIATVVWAAATIGFAFYVSNFGNYNATYGSLGAVVIFLTWIYLSAYILLLGAELNSVLEDKAGGKAKTAAQ